MKLSWKKFDALGTEFVIAAYLDDRQLDLLDEAQAVALEFSRRFSRFSADSEISRLNDAQPGEFRASPMLVDLLGRCQHYYNETSGLFDPTIIDALSAAGYDRDFKAISSQEIQRPDAGSRFANVRSGIGQGLEFTDLKIINETTLLVPKGLKLDLGGIGKGFLADLMMGTIFTDVGNCWISAGGDLLAKGSDGEKRGWQIGVEHPLFPGKQSFSFSTSGLTLGIATSSIVKRRGVSAGVEWHHIIDPRTAAPAKTDVLSATVVARTAEEADVFAKTAILLGLQPGIEFIEARDGCECALFAKDRAPALTKGFIKYL